MSAGIRHSRNTTARIGTITLAAAESGNAFTRDMVMAFRAALDELERDDDVNVVLIAGDGPDFSNDIDLAWLPDFYTRPGERVPSQRHRLGLHHELWWGPDGIYTRLLNCRKITVATARGRCFGVGFYLCLFSDLVIAANDARFAQPRWRHVGVDGDISMLVAAVGLKRASELMFCGAEWSADQAYDYGLVDRVVQPGDLEAACADMATSCAMIMRDGIATEKQVVFAALEKMQIGLGFAAASVLGGWASNVHHRPGEFNFMKALRDHGPEGAVARSDSHYRSVDDDNP